MKMDNNKNNYATGCGNMPEDISFIARDWFMGDDISYMCNTEPDPEGRNSALPSEDCAADCQEEYTAGQAFEMKEKGKLSRLEIVVSEFYQVKEKSEKEQKESSKLLYEIMSKVTAKALTEYVSENYSEIETVVFYGGDSLPAQRIILYICDCLSEILKDMPDYKLMCDSIYHMKVYLDGIKKYHVAISDSYGLGAYNRDFYSTNLRFCQAGFKRLAVCPNGDIYPCYGIRNAELWKMGAIFDRTWEESEKCQRVKNLMVRMYCKCRCQEGVWNCAWCIAKLMSKRREYEGM